MIPFMNVFLLLIATFNTIGNPISKNDVHVHINIPKEEDTYYKSESEIGNANRLFGNTAGKDCDGLRHGESRMCPDNCNTCYCSNGLIRHTLKGCPGKKRSWPTPIMRDCVQTGGKIMKHGERGMCADNCNQCSCWNGFMRSTLINCVKYPKL